MHYDIILVDGSSYLFRAYYALPPLSSPEGLPTGAMIGVLNMLHKLTQEYPDAKTVVVFDPKGPTTRHKTYPDYKANRREMPEELGQQIEPLFTFIKAMGLPLVIRDGIEADDVIASMVREYEPDYSVLISTGDKDLAQIVSPRVHLYNSMSKKLMDPQGVFDKFQVHVHQIVDYLALIGDSSDNIPGVPKVGPKTAVKWLQQYGSLDEIIAHKEAFPGKVGQYLRDSIDQCLLSRQLVTLQMDVPIPLLKELNTCPDTKRWHVLCQQWGFRQLASRFRHQTTGQQQKVDWVFEWPAGVSALYPHVEAVDGRTAVLGCAVFAQGQVKCFDWRHCKAIFPQERLSQEVIGWGLKSWICSTGRQDDFLDMGVFAYVVDSSQPIESLSMCALQYHIDSIHSDDVLGQGKQRKGWQDIEQKNYGQWLQSQMNALLILHSSLKKQVAEPCWQWLIDVEQPLISILAEMQETGIRVSEKSLAVLRQEVQIQTKRVIHDMNALIDEPINLNSPQQLRDILFNYFGYPVVEKTPSGVPSTSESALKEIVDGRPFVKHLLTYRSLAKLESTYLSGLPRHVRKDGRVHSQFNQCVTITGRLSSSDPNMQNIPIKTELGRRIRDAFVARDGDVIVAADYSQIELRLMAHFSEDPALVQAFHEGADIHAQTAAWLWGCDIDEVTSEQRRMSKAINFGLIYGMSAYGLAKQLQIDRTKAQQLIDRYFLSYPKVKEYMGHMRAVAKTTGEVGTLFNRKIQLNRATQQYGGMERLAINAPMQGSAAEIIKKAMVCCAQTNPSPEQIRLLLQVHDELVWEVEASQVQVAIKWMEKVMSQVVSLKVPLEVSIASGSSWQKAHG